MKRGNNCVIQTKDGYGYAPPPLPAFPTWRHHPPDPPPTPEGAAVPDNVGASFPFAPAHRKYGCFNEVHGHGAPYCSPYGHVCAAIRLNTDILSPFSERNLSIFNLSLEKS